MISHRLHPIDRRIGLEAGLYLGLPCTLISFSLNILKTISIVLTFVKGGVIVTVHAVYMCYSQPKISDPLKR